MKLIERTWLRALSKTLTYLFLILVVGGCTPISHTSEPNNLSTQTRENQGSGATSEVMPQGTKVDDLDLSGTPVPEVRIKIEEWAKDKLEETRVLLYNETEIPMTLKDIGVDLDTQKIIAGDPTYPWNGSAECTES